MAKLNGAFVLVRNSVTAMVIGGLLLWLIQTVRTGDLKRIDTVEAHNVAQDTSIARLNTLIAVQLDDAKKTRDALRMNQEIIMDALDIPKRMRARIDSTRWR